MDVWILAFLGMVMGGGPTIPNPNRFKFLFFAGCAGEVRYGLLAQTNLWRLNTFTRANKSGCLFIGVCGLWLTKEFTD